MESQYRLKSIDTITPTGNRLLKILTQSVNGPCPMIALVNALLLRGDVSISQDKSFISFKELTDILGSHLLKHFNTANPQDMNALLELLPTLERGLVVNVDHSSIHGFEESSSLLLFQSFGVELVHCWLADPMDTHTWNVVVKECGGMYENVQMKALEGADKEQITSDMDKLELQFSTAQSDEESTRIQKEIEAQHKLLEESDICLRFLDSTGAQMTLVGLEKLRSDLKPEAIYVLYHSSHFSTLYAKSPQQLLLLATDEGFARKNNCIWQTLDDVMGTESLFLNGNLEPYIDVDEDSEARRHAQAAMPQAEIDKLLAAQAELGESADPDLALALALQAQENAGGVQMDVDMDEVQLNRMAAERLQTEEDEAFARSIQAREQAEYDARLSRQPSPAQPSVSQPSASQSSASQPATSQPGTQTAAKVSPQPPPGKPIRSKDKKKDKECTLS
jgi:hypothetical protein